MSDIFFSIGCDPPLAGFSRSYQKHERQDKQSEIGLTDIRQADERLEKVDPEEGEKS